MRCWVLGLLVVFGCESGLARAWVMAGVMVANSSTLGLLMHGMTEAPCRWAEWAMERMKDSVAKGSVPRGTMQTF